MTDLIEELGLIATQAETSSVFTDDAQWMRTDGVAAALYRAIDRFEQLEAALREIMEVSDQKSYGFAFSDHAVYFRMARAALAGEKQDV